MARKTETCKIKDGSGKDHTVEIYQMSVTDSIRVQSRLAKVFSGPLAGLAGKLFDKKDPKKAKEINAKNAFEIFLDGNVDLEEIVSNIFENMDENLLIDTMKLISSQILVDGHKMDLPNLESYDSFGIAFMYKTIGRALKVNFGSFFGDLLGKGAGEESKLAASKGLAN